MRREIAVAAGLLLFVVALCTAAVFQSEDRSHTQESLYLEADTLELLVGRADALVEILVTSVGDTRWNSKSGEEWDGSAEVAPRQFSEISARVTEQLAGEQVLDDPLVIVVPGIANVRHENGRAPPAEAMSGGFTPQDRYILLLRKAIFEYEVGNRTVWTLAGNYEGNWRVSNDEAIRSDYRWRMPPARLKEQLENAWHAR